MELIRMEFIVTTDRILTQDDPVKYIVEPRGFEINNKKFTFLEKEISIIEGIPGRIKFSLYNQSGGIDAADIIGADFQLFSIYTGENNNEPGINIASVDEMKFFFETNDDGKINDFILPACKSKLKSANILLAPDKVMA